jgi:NhaP-type Na+/H+ or K+/H+ antiporter
MIAVIWFLVVGVLLVVMALGGSVLKRLPLSTSMLYLAVGFALGPGGFAIFYLDPIERAALLERVTEVAVLISLFSAGLKLRVGWRDPRWRTPLRLATTSMVVTVALVAALGYYGARTAARRGDPARRRARAHRPGARVRRAGGERHRPRPAPLRRSPARPG